MHFRALPKKYTLRRRLSYFAVAEVRIMTQLLLKLFVKNYNDIKDPRVRERYGLLSGFVGIAVNVLLSCSKFIIGSVSNSISITADALNNLTDALSNIVTLAGFKLSTRRPDKEHPFGHGRIEYVAALVIGFIVEMIGIELIRSSVDKIIHPEETVFSYYAVAVLVISILGKLWLAFFNTGLGKRINSPVLSASVKDSISDITATSFTLLALIISKYSGVSLDGWFGIVVSLFVMYSGYQILKESVGIILGNPPSGEFVDKLSEMIKSHNGVLGMHDLVIHSYGESCMFGTVDIEVPSNLSLVKAHNIVDEIEKRAKKELGIELAAHIDPIDESNENYEEILSVITELLKEIDENLSFHDLRIISGEREKVVFDLVIPFDYSYSPKELIELINEKAERENIKYKVKPTVEYSYI